MINSRIYLFIIILLVLGRPVEGWSQSKDSSDGRFGNYFLFNMNTTEKQHMVRQPVYFPISDTAIYQIFERINDRNAASLTATSPASAIILGVKLNPSLKHYFSATVGSISKEYYSFLIQDSSEAILVAMGINSSNYKDFRYHVVQNDSVELVPWSPVTDLRKDYGAKEPFALIGKFNHPGKWIVVEVYNVKDYRTREGVVFDWRTDLKPKLEQIIAEVPGNYFNILHPSVNRQYATRFNKITGAPDDMRLPADSIRNLIFQFKKSGTLLSAAYLISKTDKTTDTSKLGLIDNHGYFTLDGDQIREAGKYEIIFQRQTLKASWEEDQLLRIPFEVIATPSNSAIAKKLLISILITIIALLISFWIYRRTMRKHLKKMELQKEMATLKLNSIKSQLNPHFIFNALSSIQNLMNKQAIPEANHYLNKFALLTRSTLESSAQDMISLEQEWAIADNYLRMEQLRFGFHYDLQMDGTLNSSLIEVPPLLLQPLIENAVKHGIAAKKEGTIFVSAKPSGKDLVLYITDNGKGFDANMDQTGFGIRLSKERLELLNTIYADKPFSMQILSDNNGTIVTITLKNWL
ncbi:histidine kinase [Terrimonas sp. NA20]|uniref:Histidine kinase n=1 Tax=Terrimonas ginsenosidimutans TaxID=2908004 RepID=A0ABS9KU16_9BACT|nr:histidine kinase [Terrimonas ginsenosidimutans]MCG2615831.1 histidine kinase [Terrimonas ginsenosidimutans]